MVQITSSLLGKYAAVFFSNSNNYTDNNLCCFYLDLLQVLKLWMVP
jgi:hypothetical protein